MKNAKSLELLRKRAIQHEENLHEGKVSSTNEPQDLVHIRISSNIHISYIRIFSMSRKSLGERGIQTNILFICWGVLKYERYAKVADKIIDVYIESEKKFFFGIFYLLSYSELVKHI